MSGDNHITEARFEALQFEFDPSAKLADDSEQFRKIGSIASKNILLLGIPGAGKTSLVEEMAAIEPEVQYISLGQISRNLDPNSIHRQELNRLFEIGAPVGAAELFLEIIEPHIDNSVHKGRGFILDGIPKKREEVEPLVDFFDRKDIALDLIITCNLPSDLAYDRVSTRNPRAGDNDSLEIFLNRIKYYARDLDHFKEALSSQLGAGLLELDTARHTPDNLARAVIEIVQTNEEFHHEDMQSEQIAQELSEAISHGDKDRAFNVLGSIFDETLSTINHGYVLNEQRTESEIATYIESLFVQEHPELAMTPFFLQRITDNYRSTTLESVKHLYESILQEAELRHGSSFGSEEVGELLKQQIGLKEFIKQHERLLVEGKTMDDILKIELSHNRDELDHIEQFLNSYEDVGSDSLDIERLMKLQPELWGQLTSNYIIFSRDYNYRRLSNSIPDSHHSLLPFANNHRRMSANSMGNYIPFVEAVSATQNQEYSSTFGFLHFTFMDDNGEVHGVEYPIMMHDERLLSFESDLINDILKSIDSFYDNHDLWHNLIPVYSNSFILHHPDAPISYGGRPDAYTDFGTKLREYKEEYEIGLAASHMRTQLERFRENPDLRASEEGKLLNSMGMIGKIPEELNDDCPPEEIQNIIDYLACRVVSKALSIFQDSDPIFDVLSAEMQTMGIDGKTVNPSEIAKVLHNQGLFNLNNIRNILDSTNSGDDLEKEIFEMIRNDEGFVATILDESIVFDSDSVEVGAEHIYHKLDEWGVIQKIKNGEEATLSPIQKAQWLNMIAPQRIQLQGIMEKAKNKDGFIFGDSTIKDPRELVAIQKKALDTDKEELEYRVSARKQNQRLGYKIYSLIFDDKQEEQRTAREELSSLLSSPDIDQKNYALKAVGALDSIMHELVTNNYDKLTEKLDYLLSFVDVLDSKSADMQLPDAIRKVVKAYEKLSAEEREHQKILNTSYADSAKKIVDENMAIS